LNRWRFSQTNRDSNRPRFEERIFDRRRNPLLRIGVRQFDQLRADGEHVAEA
jgi:hypothetical protein